MGKIAVIGDVILDVYHFCNNRENPESSAPCFTLERTEYKPGGAGNVAANLARLGSECVLISVVGEDEESRKLDRILNSFNVKSCFIQDIKRETIVKERYLSANDGRYHFRADFEKKAYIESAHIGEILKRIEDCSLIIVSDYNKGVISKELMEQLKKRNIQIIADTKPSHIDFFNQIDLIKPNIKEVREMTGINNELEAAKFLCQKLQTNVLLSRGKDGISYFGKLGERYDFSSSIPSEKVLDVTGAGDTVIATYAHFMNKGKSPADCAKLANIAGGISVQYPGCYQVSEEEILKNS